MPHPIRDIVSTPSDTVPYPAQQLDGRQLPGQAVPDSVEETRLRHARVLSLRAFRLRRQTLAKNCALLINCICIVNVG